QRSEPETAFNSLVISAFESSDASEVINTRACRRSLLTETAVMEMSPTTLASNSREIMGANSLRKTWPIRRVRSTPCIVFAIPFAIAED
ncbi:MAG: hypothetical protein VYB82_07505, partial [Pseudomonadota bacterium]|nr:hypothetical protein [Pseudomonadota bacterium]